MYKDLNEETKGLSSISDFIRFTASYLGHKDVYFGHGTDSAYDEAVNLILASLNLSNDFDKHLWSSALTESEKSFIIDRLKLRVEKNIPVPYILKEAWFAGYSFYVDSRVIIPRSPIAEIIEEEFSPWIEPEKITKVLDLCTGSGCIGIATALSLEEVEVDAVDISDDAIAVANTNVENYDLDDRVEIIKSDLFTELSGKKYDIIISNPPYVSSQEYNDLPKEYSHEPQQALLAEDEGLAFANKILAKAGDYLNPHGILILEVGSAMYALEEKYPQAPFTWVQFDRGGDGVLLMTAKELEDFKTKYMEVTS